MTTWADPTLWLHPDRVLDVGGCARAGGVFSESHAGCGRVDNAIALPLTVPGHPPPLEILRGILTAASRIHGRVDHV